MWVCVISHRGFQFRLAKLKVINIGIGDDIEFDEYIDIHIDVATQLEKRTWHHRCLSLF